MILNWRTINTIQQLTIRSRCKEISMVNFVDKHAPREYSSLCTSNGVVLCDKVEGAFLVLRYQSDLDRLKELINKIKVVE